MFQSWSLTNSKLDQNPFKANSTDIY